MRYSDVGNMTANEHYARVGEKQGRNIRCVHFFTDFQSERYLKRYTELGDMYGRSDKPAWKAGKQHWYNNGSKQAPALSIDISYESERPFKCADYDGDCSCPGRVHMGLKFRPDTGAEITTLDDLSDWKKGESWNKDRTTNTKVTCAKNNFKKKGKKIWRHKKADDLQCFCEPVPKPDPYHCAKEGGVCSCPKGSNVFYGMRFQEYTNKLANFEQMSEWEFTGAKAPNSGEIQCVDSSFTGGSFLPGFEKDCYCDNQGVTTPEMLEDEIWYWDGVIEEHEAAEAQARAEAEAEAARIAAAQEAAALKAQIAEQEAKIHEAEAKYKAAIAAAEAKAKADAAQAEADAAAAAAAEAAREKQLAEEVK